MKPALLLFFLWLPLQAQQVRSVQPPPASTVAHGAASQSTALSAAATTEPPLSNLPSFRVRNRDGQEVASSSFVRTGRWLLLYRKENCLPCDRLMNVLAASETKESKRGAAYVVVVDSASADGLERLRSAWPAFSDAVWLADSNLEALGALQLKGAPMLYALHGNAIAFHVPGTLGDASAVEKMTKNWLTAPDASKPTDAPQGGAAAPEAKP